MKLASFISLSVVATCLSGSVWATSDLYDPQVTKEFCDAFFAEGEPEKYYGSKVKTIINDLRKYTGQEVSMEDLRELSKEAITGAAKVFLLDKQHLKKVTNKSLVVLHASSKLYRIYAWITLNGIATYWPLKEEKDITELDDKDKVDIHVYFRLRNYNRVENQAADFIEECIKLGVENEKR